MRVGAIGLLMAAAMAVPAMPAAVAAAPPGSGSRAAAAVPSAAAARTTVSIGMRTRSLLPFAVAPVSGAITPRTKGRTAVLQLAAGRSWRNVAVVRSDAKGLVRASAPTSAEGNARLRWWVPKATMVVRGKKQVLGAAASPVVTYAVAAAPRPPAPAPAGRVVTADLFGNHPLSPGFPAGAATVRLWDTGTTWSSLQPRRTTWDFTRLDALVEDAEKAGASVLLVLGGTPSWAGSPAPPGAPFEYAGPGTASPPSDPSVYEAYVRTVAKRYGTRIGAYQVWNEANIPNFFRGSPAQMVDLTVRAARAVRAEAPGALVVAPSTGTRWLSGYRAFYPAYLAGLRAAGWPVDVFAAHLYPSAAGGAEERVALLGMVRESLRAAGAPPRPLWDTEVNYGAAAAGARPLTAEQARAAVGRTYLDAVRFGLGRVYWYGWLEASFLGIGMSSGSPSSVAYGEVRRWLEGARFGGCTTVGPLTRCVLARGSAVSLVIWSSGAVVTVPRPAGTTTVHDLEARATPAPAKLAVGRTPLMLT